jgi:hypothetical protein
MSRFTQESRSVTRPITSYRQLFDLQAIELEHSSSPSSILYKPVWDSGAPEQQSPAPQNDKSQSNANHLPSKTFAAARRSTWRRFFYQTWVGFLLFIWCASIWKFTYFWPYPRGSLELSTCTNDDPNSIWTQFTPTVVYGNFTLGQAKAIDVAWNMVVGRAAQAFISFIFYGVVKDILMRITEITTVPLDLFTALAFKPFDLDSIFKMVRALPSCRGWRATVAMIWILISAIYIAAIPAINDAMTGYVLQNEIYVVFNNGTRVPVGTYMLPNGTRDFELDSGALVNVSLTEEFTEICVPRDVYQWGFAKFWVTLSASLCTAWIIGSYGIWLDAQQNSELVRKGRNMGMYRAIADTAEAIMEALGPDTNAYSNKQLKTALKKYPGVMYSVEEKAEIGAEHIRLSSKKAERLQLSWVRKYGA